jgi:hypothetical protein
MLILLDLEETVIEDWSNMSLMPRECMAIRSFLRTCHPGATIGLMSWAVWHDKDKALFNKHLRDELEAVLEVKFSDEWLLSMDDWAKMLFHHCKKKLSRDDLFDCFGKQEVLFLASRFVPAFKDQFVLLVDDVVEHGLHWESPQNNCTVTMENVKETVASEQRAKKLLKSR